MGNPATLTDIDGIGPATAEKLATAGFATLADLAGADATKLGELEGMPPGADFAAWIKAAEAATAQGENGKAAKAKKPKAKKPPKDEIAQAAAFDGPVLVVTGPKKGFRRGGFPFGKEPIVITDAPSVKDVDGVRRMLAILSEEKLTCVIRYPDGVEASIDRQAAEDLHASIAGRTDIDVGSEEFADLIRPIFDPT